MCDTFVALGSATKDRGVVFGKNSDRPYAERQPLVYIPRTLYSQDTEIRCTHISIPQVEETYAILLSKPSWMWGAEMSANEWNVVIGNEAVWTKEPMGQPALLGMDLLRLALERASTASQAVHLICDLLEEYGQGGACAENDPGFTYHNSFLIADPTEAWVLETAGKWWVAQRIKDGVRNISNGLSIRSEFNLAREGMVDYAIDQGYCEDSNSFDFARCFSIGGYQEPTRFSREGWGRHLLQMYYGKIGPDVMIEILRDHSGGICMHGGFRTTASQVSYLLNECSIHWFTGSPHPCRSFFKPFIVPDSEKPEIIDIWEQREQLDPVKNESGIQELHAFEKELIRTILQSLQKNHSLTTEILVLTQEALKRELILLSM